MSDNDKMGMVLMAALPAVLGGLLGGKTGALAGAKAGETGTKFIYDENKEARKEQKESAILKAKSAADLRTASQKDQEIDLKKEGLKIQKEVADSTIRKNNQTAKTAGTKMTDAQSKSLGFGRRAMLADQMINELSSDPSADVTSLRTQMKMAMPKWMGGFQNDQEQALAMAKLSFVSSVLRKESGAAVTPNEFSTYDKIYFPQPGDSEQTQSNKEILRKNFIDTEKLTAGSAWQDPIPLQKSATKEREDSLRNNNSHGSDEEASLKRQARIQELLAKRNEK
jgi:hypothetical protein